jgi:DNA modification methylase
VTPAPWTAPYYRDAEATVYHGGCLDVLRADALGYDYRLGYGAGPALFPDDSVDAIVTDPPYGLANTTAPLVLETLTRWVSGDREYVPGGKGFMGKAWDAFVPPPAVWDEAYRVLKPGGFLLAFAGSRTFDLMGLSVRLAGFEVRDGLAWLYGSGFPKSLDVTDVVERWEAGERWEATGPRPIRPGVYEATAFLRAARDKAGWNNKRIDQLFGTNGMAGHWTSSTSQPSVPSVRQWEVLKEHLGFGDELDDLVAELGSTERPEDWGQGEESGEFLGALANDPDADPAGDWGTALKPAFEPVVVARKPFGGTVAANVLTHGTGAIHVAGCRTPSGRWPTNVLLDESQADELDRQAPNVGAAGRAQGPSRSGTSTSSSRGVFNGTDEPAPFYADRGGASRLFPTFKYEPKAPTWERPKVDGVAHPTVKPLGLMRWLVRLVTPKDGKVLDLFGGSGTTGEGAVAEGFDVTLIERDADYLPLIRHRLTRPIQQGLDFDLFGT